MSAYSYAFGFTTGDSISNKIVWKNNHPENPLDIFWGATQYVFKSLLVAPQINIVSLWKINYHYVFNKSFPKIHKKWCFPLMVFSVNVNKSVSCGFGLKKSFKKNFIFLFSIQWLLRYFFKTRFILPSSLKFTVIKISRKPLWALHNILLC